MGGKRHANKFFFISYHSVYSAADYKTDQLFNAESPLEGFLESRRAYYASKQTPEGFVMEAMRNEEYSSWY